MSQDKVMVNPKPLALKPVTDFSGRQERDNSTNYTDFDERPGSFRNVKKRKRADREGV